MTDIERHRASPAKESFTSPRRNSHSGHKKKQSGEMQFLPGGSKRDPLNLEGLERKRQRQTTPNPEGDDTEMPSPSKRDSSSQGGNNKRRRKDSSSSAKRLMSPSAKQHRHHSPSVDAKKATNEREPTEKEKAIDNAAELRKKKKEYFNNKYRYGNFDRYYGHRLSQGETDPRMTLMSKDWFEKRTVLDIGCNVGFLTLSIARDYNPRRILGIDIDEHLIGVARKNIRHYCDKDTQLVGKFPASFAAQFGTISKQPVPTFSTKFPDNIWFRKENYVLECDEMLDMVEPEFDTILALSITKWIHLNYGDDGMRRFFRRAFEQLQPGGRLIVEPQPFNSYKKRAFMTEHLKTTYATIQFKPEDFESYLVDIVGFERVEHLGIPPAMSKGFERPLEVYVKSQKPIKAKKAKEGAKSTEPDSSSTGSDAPSADATPSGSSEPIQQ